MFAILYALGMLIVDLFKSRSRLEAENLFLRHQLNVALRRAPHRLQLRGSDPNGVLQFNEESRRPLVWTDWKSMGTITLRTRND